MDKSKEKRDRRVRHHRKVRTKISGTASRPRMSVYKSNRYIYAQLVDDERGKTLVYVTSRNVKKNSPTEQAKAVGEEIAKCAKKKKIKSVIFDRGGFIYKGRVRAVADGAGCTDFVEMELVGKLGFSGQGLRCDQQAQKRNPHSS